MSKNEVFRHFLENASKFLAEISYLDSSHHYLQLFYWGQGQEMAISRFDCINMRLNDFSRKVFKIEASNFTEMYIGLLSTTYGEFLIWLGRQYAKCFVYFFVFRFVLVLVFVFLT